MKSWYSFTVPRRVERWVDLGTAGRVHTARAHGCKSQWLCDKHNCPQRDSIPGPHALQSDMLLDDCELHQWDEVSASSRIFFSQSLYVSVLHSCYICVCVHITGVYNSGNLMEFNGSSWKYLCDWSIGSTSTYNTRLLSISSRNLLPQIILKWPNIVWL